MGNFSGSLGGHFTWHQDVWEVSVDTANNRSLVRCHVYITCDSTGTGVYNSSGPSWSANVSGNAMGGSFTYDFRGNANAIDLATFDTWVGHNSVGDGSSSFSGSANMADSPYVTTASSSGTIGLTHIDRYATITSFNISGVTDTSLTFTWASSNTVDTISWWSTAYDGGTHHDQAATGTGTFSQTLSNLVSNKSYDITVAVRRADSGLWTTSSPSSATTLTQDNFIPFLIGRM